MLIIKKKKKKHYKVVLLAETKLQLKEVLISEALIDSNITHDEFVLVTLTMFDVFKWYNVMKEAFKNPGDRKTSCSQRKVYY